MLAGRPAGATPTASTSSTSSSCPTRWAAARQRARQQRRAGARVAARTVDPELAQLLGDAFLRPQYDELSDEHVTDLVEAAAGLISVVDDLRPLDPAAFNAFAEIWRAIAAVPPGDRVRILDELEPGAVFSLWKASLGRYVLDEARAGELLSDFFIWDDFPSQPGQVITYEGLCEQFRVEAAGSPLSVDSAMQARFPRAVPWLKPSASSIAAPRERFTQHFFQAGRTGLLHSRMTLDMGWASFLSPPIYNRLEIGLTLTPNSPDAGADAALVYPMDPVLLKQKQDAGVALSKEDLPSPLWPAPSRRAAWSPLSFAERDYMRVAGPGFYVGCAYRRDAAGGLLVDEAVYFALVRTTY